MPRTTTISARLDQKLDEKLSRIAKSMGRSKSWALSQAIEGYLAANDGHVAAVEKGRRDFAEGRSFDQDEIEAFFAAKRNGKKRRKRAA